MPCPYSPNVSQDPPPNREIDHLFVGSGAKPWMYK